MNEQEYKEKKDNLLNKLEQSGINKEESSKYIDSIYIESKVQLKMDEESAMKRSLIATVNYYRKYFDKLGNRIEFMCLGISGVTDFGLKKKMYEVINTYKKHKMDEDNSAINNMIKEGLISQDGTPLHTHDTTFIEDLIGRPINIDDSLSQSLYGVIKVNEDGGKLYPCVVRCSGKLACEQPKMQYIWTFISAKQINTTKNPGFISLSSRELNMTKVKDAKRIDMTEYKNIIDKCYLQYKKDVFTDSINVDEDTISVVFNSRISDLKIFNGKFTGDITLNKDIYDDFNHSIIADLRISNGFKIDIDINSDEEVVLFGMLRKKKQSELKPIIDVYGIYVENPTDKIKFEMDEHFGKEDDKANDVPFPMGKSNVGNKSSDFFDVASSTYKYEN